jgi:hypothetical protein
MNRTSLEPMPQLYIGFDTLSIGMVDASNIIRLAATHRTPGPTYGL